MSTFEESLRNALVGLDESYETAERDLLEAATRASESVERVTNGAARLALNKLKENPQRTTFALYVVDGELLHEINFFFIDSAGYPIRVTASELGLRTKSFEGILKTSEDVTGFFEQLAANPNSRLVLRISYILRRNKIERNQATEQESE